MLDDPAFGRRRVTVNHDESPLAWLRRRKDAQRPADDRRREFAAGERLRADYERAQLMPRVTANWTAAVAGKRRSGEQRHRRPDRSRRSRARRRVEAALKSLEPEMANLAVDFCCFLKGLEQIERERQWPARSAKVVLRLALAALARHYGLSTRARGPAVRRGCATGARRATGRRSIDGELKRWRQRSRVRLDAVDQRAQTVRPLRGQVRPEAEPVEQGVGVGRDDLRRRLAVEERDGDGDQPAHDERVAVADEMQHRFARLRSLAAW